MKLMNCDMSVFVETFGVEGASLIDGHNVQVFLINDSTAVEMGLGGLDAVTAGNFLRKAEEDYVATMFFNVDRMLGSMNALISTVKGARQEHFCGILVHELVHVEQMRTKRFWVEDGSVVWEGKPVKVVNDNSASYMSTPWEVEAYLAQIEYMFPGDQAKVDEFMNKIKAA